MGKQKETTVMLSPGVAVKKYLLLFGMTLLLTMAACTWLFADIIGEFLRRASLLGLLVLGGLGLLGLVGALGALLLGLGRGTLGLLVSFEQWRQEQARVQLIRAEATAKLAVVEVVKPGHAIYTNVALSERYVPALPDTQRPSLTDEEPARPPVLPLLRSERVALVYGVPGLGKTSLLQLDAHHQINQGQRVTIIDRKASLHPFWPGAARLVTEPEAIQATVTAWIEEGERRNRLERAEVERLERHLLYIDDVLQVNEILGDDSYLAVILNDFREARLGCKLGGHSSNVDKLGLDSHEREGVLLIKLKGLTAADDTGRILSRWAEVKKGDLLEGEYSLPDVVQLNRLQAVSTGVSTPQIPPGDGWDTEGDTPRIRPDDGGDTPPDTGLAVRWRTRQLDISRYDQSEAKRVFEQTGQLEAVIDALGIRGTQAKRLTIAKGLVNGTYRQPWRFPGKQGGAG